MAETKRSKQSKKYTYDETRSLYINAMHTEDTLKEALVFAKRGRANRKFLDKIRSAIKSAGGMVRHAALRFQSAAKRGEA